VGSRTPRRASTRCRFVAETGWLSGRQREAQVRVRELGAQPVAGDPDDRRVVERRLGQVGHRVPASVARHNGIRVTRHEAEERGRDEPDAGHPVRLAEHAELLHVGDFPHVDLVGELAEHGGLHVLGVAEGPAGQRPAPRVGLLRTLPEQHLKGFVADLQDGRQHFMSGFRFPAGNIAHSFRL
jgi:hypothetical protein